MEDGIIIVDTDRAKEFGFTSDKFYKAVSYLFKEKNRILISAIVSVQEGKGYFKELVKNIVDKGYQVAVPTPLPKMEAILRGWNWKITCEHSCQMGEDIIIYVNK